MRIDGHNGTRPLGALLRDLAESGVSLVRGEARLARVEMMDTVTTAATGTALVSTGAVLALLGGLSVLAGIVLLIGDQWLPADLYWVAALIVLVIAGAAALSFAKRAMGFLSPARLAPEETMTTLKEDEEWLKQRLTSGATSS
jgi:uncharacterized membrane protein YqjE